MTPPADLLVVSEIFPPAIGGSGELLANVYSRLSGTSTVVLADGLGGEERRGTLRVVRRPIKVPGGGLLNPRSLGRYIALVGRIRAMAGPRAWVHCGKVLPEGLAALMSRRLGGSPYVCWAHGEEVVFLKSSRELGWLGRRVYAGSEAILVNSESTRQTIMALGVEAEKFRVIYPGVDATRFAPEVDARGLRERFVAPGELLLLSVGRLQRRKGHDLVIRALALLGSPDISVRYVIIGDGEERARLEELVEATGLRERVSFAGAVAAADLPAYYAACDIFLMPNRVDGLDFEGFGMVFLEAAASGRPSIGGRSGGVPEAVEDGVTGLLVNGEDAAELADAIARLARSRTLRQEMGAAGRARVLRQFTWERAAEKLAAVQAALGASGVTEVRVPERPCVMQVVLSLTPGGAERLVIETAKRIRGQMSSAICALDGPGAWDREVRDAGIPLAILDRQPGFHPALAWRLARAAAEFGADILHCHQYSPFVYGALASLLRPSLRLVVTEHGRLAGAVPSRRRRLINPFLARVPDAVFAVSEELRQHMLTEGYPPARVAVIRNGIDPGSIATDIDRRARRAHLDIPERTFVIGSVARLDPVKNFGALLDALVEIRRDVPGAMLVLVGDGPERERLMARRDTLGVQHAVRFTGHRADARQILAALDVYVNSSTSEGISLTLLEAMAAGLPVVATRVGGTPEVVLDGETGLLVGPGQPDALAASCVKLERAPERARALGLAGRERVTRDFTLDGMLDRYLEVYRRLAPAMVN